MKLYYTYSIIFVLSRVIQLTQQVEKCKYEMEVYIQEKMWAVDANGGIYAINYQQFARETK